MGLQAESKTLGNASNDLNVYCDIWSMEHGNVEAFD